MKKSDLMQKKKPLATIAILSLSSSAMATTIVCASEPDDREVQSTGNSSDLFTVKFSGRIQTDYTNSHADIANVNFDEFDLRRAYLGASGTIGGQLSWTVVGNIDDSGDVGLVKAYADWRPNAGKLKIRLGQFKAPASLDEMTSSRFSSTLERAAFTDANEFNRRLGVGLFHSGHKHTLSAAFSGGQIARQPFSSGKVIGARATFAPVKFAYQNLHFGTSIRYRSNGDSTELIRYRQRPYAHTLDRIISTGKIAESDLFVGVEFAYTYQGFWTAGEYSITSAKCAACVTDPTFRGHYIEAGWFLGGWKTYSDGKFGRPKIHHSVTKGGLGAVSFVVRYDGLDLNDESVQGGDLKTVITGIDWWPTDHARIGFNYFHGDAMLGNRRSGLGRAFSDLVNAGISNENVDGVVIRAQFDF